MPSRTPARSWERLGTLAPGAGIEVVTAEGRTKGDLVSTTTASLTVATRRGERNFQRSEIVKVVSRTQTRRLRNMAIGAGIGAAIALCTDKTLGEYLRNEGAGGRGAIWALPIALFGGVGAAFPSYPVVYRK